MLGVGGGRLGNGGVPVLLQAVHLISLVAVTGGIVAAAAAMVRGAIRGQGSAAQARPDWRLDHLLVLAALADLVIFVVLADTSDDPGFLRYLTAAVVFSAVLAGRWVGRLARRWLPGAAGEEASSRLPALSSPSASRESPQHPPLPLGSPLPPRCPRNHLPSSARSSKVVNWSSGSANSGVPRSPPWQPAAP